MCFTTPRLPRLCAALFLATLIGVAASAFAGDEPELRLPPDVTYKAADDSPGPVVFSHPSHVALADNKCTTCHPGPFSILHPTARLTHEEMDAGKRCGMCHDGKQASNVQEECDACHKQEAAP